ncbi:hypothetical protein [Chryseobacterium sp.]|uniref:hypothetical protein n=1 Tax=Chryseobacterium sp. TaxID=1871047 RepID=UPI002FCB9144
MRLIIDKILYKRSKQMGFFKNLKEGIAAQKKLVDAINKGDLVVDRKNLTIKPEKTSENNREESEQKK